ncbi:conserved hypothetical protein [[Clostridium] ultunense Esp]|uniref:CD1247 N-terminal domain-containing protein n=1 Tax=Thermicanus aegyptius TaxID=94009 RepID=UPI0002B6EE4A|nr:CD1247 N-terminal domain-containing protein [Thermicanus aegyptius]CCQ94460.1 conserved hypothetical protein [[Clostridium] ultunense Esp]
MEKIDKNLSYMEGLVEGLDLDPSTKEGRAIFELIQFNKKMAEEIRDLKLRLTDQEEFIEALDEDLYEVESLLFEYEGDSEEKEFMESAEKNIQGDRKEEQDEGDEEGFYEMECPNCDEMILIDAELMEENDQVELVCPECKEVIVLNVEDQRLSGNEEGKPTRSKTEVRQ